MIEPSIGMHLCLLPGPRRPSRVSVRQAAENQQTLIRNPAKGEQGSESPVSGPAKPPCVGFLRLRSGQVAQHPVATLAPACTLALALRASAVLVSAGERRGKCHPRLLVSAKQCRLRQTCFSIPTMSNPWVKGNKHPSGASPTETPERPRRHAA